MKPNTLFSYLIGIALLLLAAHPAHATNRTVTSTTDSGSGTLRDAIAASAASGDTIDFSLAPNSTISLTSGELLIDRNVSINGPGANVLTVARSAGGSFFRIFRIANSGVTASVSGLTMSNGQLNATNTGGGIYNIGTLTLNSCAISGNLVMQHGVTNYGGGIWNNGTLTMTGCTVNGNTAGVSFPDTAGYGGGIYNVGTLDMTNCTLSANSAIGASSSNNGNVLAAGGGIYNTNIFSNALTLTNCTLSGNSVSVGIGANFAEGGGLAQNSGDLPDVQNTIIAGNTATANGGASAISPDVFGTVNSLGHNLVGNTTNSSGWVASDKTNANAMPLNLGFLQIFGGHTRILPLLAGSVAIDAGDDSVTGPPLDLTTDQRGPGFPRGLGGHVDIGAFEFNPLFVVTTISDSDDGACDSSCTLREAISAANTAPGDNTITFAPGVSTIIQLSSALPDISTNMTIQGPGAGVLTVHRNTSDSYRVFTVDNGTTAGPTVTLSGLTISNGTSPQPSGFPDGVGGGVFGSSATITISNCVITHNTANEGAGIGNNRGNLTIDRSTISANMATSVGAGVFNSGDTGSGVLNITNSTIYGNLASGGDGGGIFNLSGAASLINCTLYNNNADSGGAILNDAIITNASLTLRSSTFSFNSTSNPASGNVSNNQVLGGVASMTLDSCIFQTGMQGFNLANTAGNITSQGYNLSNDAAGGDTSTGPGGFLNGPGDIRNTDPMLGALANNGGPTLTVALLAGSQAINHGDPNAPLQDQRYYLRSGAPDIGAFEFGGTLAPISAVSRKTHGPSTFDINLPVIGTAGVECRSGGATNDHLMVVTFPTSVMVTSAQVTTGTGSVSELDNDAHGQLAIHLTGVTNAQRIVTTLSNVSDGVNSANITIPMAVLLGDTTGNGSVNASDVGLTKVKSGQPVDASNFREDVTVNNSINASDVSFVKSRSGTALP